MHPQDALTVRRTLMRAKEVDGVAKWFIDLLLVPAAEQNGRAIYLTFAPSLSPDTCFCLEAHRQRFVGICSHVMQGDTLTGLIQVVPASRDGTLGEPIYELTVNDVGVVLPGGNFIEQHFVRQEEYDQVRAQVSMGILAAVQAHLPRRS